MNPAWIKYLLDLVGLVAGLAKAAGATEEDLVDVVKKARAMPAAIDKSEADALAAEKAAADAAAKTP